MKASASIKHPTLGYLSISVDIDHDDTYDKMENEYPLYDFEPINNPPSWLIEHDYDEHGLLNDGVDFIFKVSNRHDCDDLYFRYSLIRAIEDTGNRTHYLDVSEWSKRVVDAENQLIDCIQDLENWLNDDYWYGVLSYNISKAKKHLVNGSYVLSSETIVDSSTGGVCVSTIDYELSNVISQILSEEIDCDDVFKRELSHKIIINE